MADAAVAEKPKTEKKPEAQKSKAKKYRFKLLRGQYTEAKDENGRDITYQANPKKGVFPVIETDVDLSVYNGQHAGMQKFERVFGSATQTVTDPTKRLEGETINAYHKRMEDLQKTIKAQLDETIKKLDKMTQDELVALAQAEEIDISACKTVGDVRNTIRESLFS